MCARLFSALGQLLPQGRVLLASTGHQATLLRAETFGWLLAQILEVHEGVAGFDKGLWRRAATEADDMLSLLAQPACGLGR